MKQGIIMELSAQTAYVFTNDCQLVEMPANRDMFVGQAIRMPEIEQKAPRRRWLVSALAAACLVLLISTGILLSALVLPQASTAYLSLDVNPSIEFKLDAERKVVEATPLNSDAWTLLQKTSLIGLTYEDAIVEWIQQIREHFPKHYEDLLISAVLSKRDKALADELMSLDGEAAAKRLAQLQGLNVKVLFSTDAKIKEQADSNQLSIGRQLLLNMAREQDAGLDTEDIRDGVLSDLLNCLLPDQTGQTTETIAETTVKETTQTPTETTAKETTEETTEKETTTTTTVKETTKATTKAATTAKPVSALNVEVDSSAEGWTIYWTKSPEDKTLSYYKVVISQGDSTPKYPDNGYLYAITNRTSNSCTANNSKAYNGGDFGGYLTPGQKYYVSITYVYKDGSKAYSNVIRTTYNGPAHAEPAPFNPTLEGTTDSEGFHLGWTISPDDRTLKYYKVVISQYDSTPQYSENGYLYALSKSQNACLADNSSKYNSGDFGYYMVPGQTYYVAVTYVFSDTKITSNVLQLTYNGPSTVTPTPSPTPAPFEPSLAAESDETGFHLSWTISPEDRTLSYYKVVISQYDSSPQYSENGYLYALGRSTTTCLADNSSNYNNGDFGYTMVYGQTYYVAITYVFSDTKITSNVLQLTYQGPVPE